MRVLAGRPPRYGTNRLAIRGPKLTTHLSPPATNDFTTPQRLENPLKFKSEGRYRRSRDWSRVALSRSAPQDRLRSRRAPYCRRRPPALEDHQNRPEYPNSTETHGKRALLDGRRAGRSQAPLRGPHPAKTAPSGPATSRPLASTKKIAQTTQRATKTRSRPPNIPGLPGGTGRLAFMLRGQPGRPTQHPNRGTCVSQVRLPGEGIGLFGETRTSKRQSIGTTGRPSPTAGRVQLFGRRERRIRPPWQPKVENEPRPARGPSSTF